MKVLLKTENGEEYYGTSGNLWIMDTYSKYRTVPSPTSTVLVTYFYSSVVDRNGWQEEIMIIISRLKK